MRDAAARLMRENSTLFYVADDDRSDDTTHHVYDDIFVYDVAVRCHDPFDGVTRYAPDAAMMPHAVTFA